MTAKKKRNPCEQKIMARLKKRSDFRLDSENLRQDGPHALNIAANSQISANLQVDGFTPNRDEPRAKELNCRLIEHPVPVLTGKLPKPRDRKNLNCRD